MMLLLPACALFGGKRENPDQMTVEQLYAQAQTALHRGNYGGAEKLYERLIARFPFGPYTEQSQLELAYAQYKNDNPDDAYSTINRFIKTYPAAKHIDYAYYLRGLINFNRSGGMLVQLFAQDRSRRDQGYAVQSFDDFSQLLQRYPGSKYAPDARQRMIWLRNGLAQFELNIAEYYLRRKVYVAALDRAQYIIEHYQQAPQTGDALAVMVKAYQALGETTLANDSLSVLKLNYPNHPYFKDPQAWPSHPSMWWRLIPFMGGG